MIFRDAFVFELRRQLRSPGAWVACLAVLAAGSLSILVGGRHVSTWRDALTAAGSAAAQSQHEARGYMTAGQPGPEGRPWVDLSEPLWQDWYSGVRMVREPAPLAHISAGRADHSVVAMRLSRMANPLEGESLRLDNPELLPSGGIDLIFVLTCLLPLLLLGLGYGIGSTEREDGTWRVLQVQCPRLSSWLNGRVAAVFAIVEALGLVLIVAAALMSAAEGASVWGVALVLVLLQCAVLLPFGALLAWSAASSAGRTTQASALGVAWILLAVVLPAAASDVLLADESQRLARQASVAARAVRQEVYEEPVEELRKRVLRRRPELAELAYAGADEPDPSLDRHLFDVELQHHYGELFASESVALAASNDRAFAWGVLSPVACVQLLAEHLAGRSPAQAHAFRAGCVDLIAARTSQVLDAAWRRQPLDLESFARFAPSTTLTVEVRSDLPLPAIQGLLGWLALSLVAFGYASWSLRRTG